VKSLTAASVVARKVCAELTVQPGLTNGVVQLFGCSAVELGKLATEFQTKLSVRVGLMPFQSCFGLNLTAATHNILLSPSSSTAVEEQALGRSLRIGSKHKEVKIVWLVVSDTMESKRVAKRQRNDSSLLWRVDEEVGIMKEMLAEELQVQISP